MHALSSLIGLLLAGAVLAQQAFLPGKQYTFSYEGRVASGLIGAPPQYAGLGIKAKILCTPKEPEHIVVEIKEARVGKLNEKLSSEQTFYTEELPISYSPISQYARELETPFVIIVKSGVVMSIHVEERETTIIRNIKKSVASMIQMNVNGVEKFSQEPDMLLPETGDKSQQMSFTVMEESIIGVCETLYTVSPLPEYLALAEEAQVPQYLRRVSADGHLVVTKTINPANCIRKAEFKQVAPHSDECQSPDDNCRSTQSHTSYTRYLIEGNRNNYLLKAIWNEGTIILRADDMDVKILSHQTMFLQSMVKKDAPHVNPPAALPLMFDIPTMTPGVQSLNEQTLLKKPIFPLEPSIHREIPSNEIMPKIVQLLEEVSREVEEFRPPVQSVIPMKTLTIVKGMQMLKYQDLTTVTRQIMETSAESKQEQTKRQVYCDCLALAGTNPSILVIKDLIAEGKLKGERAAQVLMTIPMTLSIPVPQMIEKLLEITQMSSVRSHHQMHSSALLALSHVTYKACINQNISRSSYPVHLFPEEICKPDSEVVVGKVIPHLQQLLQSAQTQYEKEVVIRALANIAHPQVLHILKPYILGSQQHKEVQTRTIAILSLERLAKLSSKQVREVLIPIMSNPMDHYEPRIAAITMLLETNPPPALFHKIALMTWMEPSQQVNSYIYSTFKTLSNVTYPTVNATELARKSEMALLLTKPVEEGVYYSRSTYISSNVRELNVASLLHTGMISSSDSLIPRTIYTKLYSYLFGYKFHPLEISFFNQGTQTLINKLLFPQEARQQDSSFPFSFWSQSGPEIMKKIKNDIKQSDLPKGKLFVKWYNAMERIFSYEETNSIIRELLEQQTLNLEKLNGETQLNFQKVFPQRDYLVTVPTEIGVPVVISIKMPVVFSLRGRIHTNIQPSRINPANLLKNQPPMTVEVTAEVKPLFSVLRLATSSIVTPFFEEELIAGVEQPAEIALPGTLHFKLDSSSKKVEIDYKPVQQPSEIYVYYWHIRPFTAVYNPLQMTPLTLAPGFKTVHKPEKTWKKSLEVGKDYLGLDLIAYLETDMPVVGPANFYEHFKHYNLLTGLNFLWATSRPYLNMKNVLMFRPSHSETKNLKMTYQYKSHMINNQRNDDAVSAPSNSWFDRMINPGLPLPRPFRPVSYNGAVNHTIYTNINLEGSNPRVYEAMASIVNYTTPQVHTVNVTTAFRAQQVPRISPFAIYTESVLQMPTIKEHNLQGLLNKPVYAVASTNISLPMHSALQFRVKMERDEIQKQFAEMSPESKRCQQNEQQGWLYSHNCTIAKLQATALNNITVEVGRVGIPVTNTAYLMLNKIDYFVKYMLYPYMEIDPTMYSTKPTDVELYLRRNPFRQIWDGEAKKPYETTRFINITEKPNVPYVLPLNLYLTPEPIAPKPVPCEQLYPTCIVQPTFLKTYDNMTLPLREVSPNCWHLLTKDCSDEARFAVFVKPSPSGKETKIVLGKTEIHIVPSGQYPQVSINEKQVHLTPDNLNHPVYEYENGYQVVMVKPLPSGKVQIYSPLYHVKVYHDGQNVIVEPFSSYRGRMCGLCGDLNGERTADLKTPEMCVMNTTSVKEFFASWMLTEGSCHQYKVPEDQCHRPNYVPTGEITSNEAPEVPRNSQSNESNTEMKTITTISTDGRLCHSIHWVEVCRPGYVPITYNPQQVEFCCDSNCTSRPVQDRRVDVTEYMRYLPGKCGLAH